MDFFISALAITTAVVSFFGKQYEELHHEKFKNDLYDPIVEKYFLDRAETMEVIDMIQNVNNVAFTYIPDLSGFKKLKVLKCYHRNIKRIIKLPDTLEEFYIENCSLESLPNLPSNLKILSCANNKLKELPKLNENLVELYCGKNMLEKLPVLPPNLKILCCKDNWLKSLPELPSTLITLSCPINSIESLPILNENLKHLICENNKLIELPKLPEHIQFVDINKNPIENTGIGMINRKILENIYYLEYDRNILTIKNEKCDLIYKCIQDNKNYYKNYIQTISSSYINFYKNYSNTYAKILNEHSFSSNLYKILSLKISIDYQISLILAEKILDNPWNHFPPEGNATISEAKENHYEPKSRIYYNLNHHNIMFPILSGGLQNGVAFTNY